MGPIDESEYAVNERLDKIKNSRIDLKTCISKALCVFLRKEEIRLLFYQQHWVGNM
tara:strand:- start:657 stop:824 length:168 start_codon:yes stop_codon:yes gene_type:complete